MCEKCGKVVMYTDPNVQAFQAVENPDQFCECLDISRPTDEIRKFLMRRARGHTENKDNRFFISAETGELKSSGYLQGNGDWFPSTPKGTYEVAVSYEPFLSYVQLDEYVELAIQAFEAGY